MTSHGKSIPKAPPGPKSKKDEVWIPKGSLGAQRFNHFQKPEKFPIRDDILPISIPISAESINSLCGLGM